MLRTKKREPGFISGIANTFVHRPFAQLLATLQDHGYERGSRAAINWRFNVAGFGVGLDGQRYQHGWEPEGTSGDTPIMTALRLSKEGELSATAQLLLSKGVDLMKENHQGQNAFYIACAKESDIALEAICAHWTKAHPEPENALAKRCPSLLADVAFAGEMAAVKYLLEKQEFSLLAGTNYSAALYRAVEGGKEAIQVYLIEKGAKPDEALSYSGMTALDCACKLKDGKAAQRLANAGATLSSALIAQQDKPRELVETSKFAELPSSPLSRAAASSLSPVFSPAPSPSPAMREELNGSALLPGAVSSPAYHGYRRHTRTSSTGSVMIITDTSAAESPPSVVAENKPRINS